MGTLLKWLFGLIIVLVLLIVAAVVVLPMVIDPNDYKPQIVDKAKQQLGREFAIEQEQQRLRAHTVRPSDLTPEQAHDLLNDELRRETKALDLLSRPQLDYHKLMTIRGVGPGHNDPKVAEQVEIQAKYAGYIDRQKLEIARTRESAGLSLPEDFDYSLVHGLSAELREKFTRHKP